MPLELVVPPTDDFSIRNFEPGPKRRGRPHIAYASDEFLVDLDLFPESFSRPSRLYAWEEDLSPMMKRADIFSDEHDDSVTLWHIYYTLMQQQTPQNFGYLSQVGSTEFYLGGNACALVYPYHPKEKAAPEGWGITLRQRTGHMADHLGITGTKCVMLPHWHHEHRSRAFLGGNRSIPGRDDGDCGLW